MREEGGGGGLEEGGVGGGERRAETGLSVLKKPQQILF